MKVKVKKVGQAGRQAGGRGVGEEERGKVKRGKWEFGYACAQLLQFHLKYRKLCRGWVRVRRERERGVTRIPVGSVQYK